MSTVPTVRTSTTSRRTALANLGAGGLGFAVATTRSAAAQEGALSATTEHPWAGTWIVQFADPAAQPAISVWGADGSFIDAGGGLTGVWEATGERTALHSGVRFFPDNSGYIVVSGTITVDETGDAWTQPYSSMVVAPDGTVVSTESGTVRGTRIRPVPENDIGARLAAIPTWTPEVATPAP